MASVHEALRAVGRELMRNHLKHCATSAIRSGPDQLHVMYDELVNSRRLPGFGKPDFVPQIGKFTYAGGTLTLAGRIRLRQRDGTPLSGLPQPNMEGLTILRDGTAVVGIMQSPLDNPPRARARPAARRAWRGSSITT